MKILCICPIGIGNYLLCYPAWKLLARYLPDARLHLLALRKPIVDLAARDPLWQRIHCIDPTKDKGPGAVVSFILRLRHERYDAGISYFPSNTWQYNLLPFLAGIRVRTAFHYLLKGTGSLSLLATSRLPVDPRLHDVRQNIMLTGHFLKKDLSEEPAEFPQLFTDDDVSRMAEFLPGGGRRYIAVHPGSSAEHGMDAKRWPAERFGVLAERAAKRLGAHVLIFGGPEETTLKRKTASCLSQPYRIIDSMPLPLTAAILRRCVFCLCNDSGIMHLAACGGVPTAALFGPTDERRNGPYGDHHCIIRKRDGTGPLWTAANVGSRSVPAGTDPRRSLLGLTVDEAWAQLEPFLHRIPL